MCYIKLLTCNLNLLAMLFTRKILKYCERDNHSSFILKHLFLILFIMLFAFSASIAHTDFQKQTEIAKKPVYPKNNSPAKKKSYKKPKILNSSKLLNTKSEYKNSFTANISAYTASTDECGKNDGITASGKTVKPNHTIACPKEYKFGTKIQVEGYGIFICEDRGGAIKGNKFDIYMTTKKEAFDFGRKKLKVKILS